MLPNVSPEQRSELKLVPQVVYHDAHVVCPWPGCRFRIAGIRFNVEAMGDPSFNARATAAWWQGPGLVGRCPRCGQHVLYAMSDKQRVADPAGLTVLPDDWHQHAFLVKGPGQSSDAGLVTYNRLSVFMITVVHALMLLALFSGMLLVVPSMKNIFKDFQMKLPLLTELVIGLVDACFLAPVLFVVLIGADVLVLYSLADKPALRWTWACLVFVILLLLPFVCALAVWLPFMTLMEGLAR